MPYERLTSGCCQQRDDCDQPASNMLNDEMTLLTATAASAGVFGGDEYTSMCSGHLAWPGSACRSALLAENLR